MLMPDAHARWKNRPADVLEWEHFMIKPLLCMALVKNYPKYGNI